MVRIRTVGMALAAVLALSAFAASAAMAEGTYTANTYPATGTATSALGNDTFTTEAGNVECKSEYSSTLTEASNHLTVKPKYTECKAFGFASATVNMGSCDYTFTTPVTEKLTVSEHDWTAKVKVVCTKATEPITISAGACETTIGEQEPEGHVIITTTTTGPKHLDFQSTFTNVTYNVTKDGFLCPFNGTGHKTGASYTQHEEVTVVPHSSKHFFDVVHP